jgi:AhpC/TSA family
MGHRFALVAVLAVLVLVVAGCAGDPAPDLHVTDFDGRTITLGGFRGQPVVVNFFESW